MGGQLANQLDLLLAERGDRQFGVVSREQLLNDGATPRVISAAVARRRLRPLFRGVYAIGHTAIRREGWWLAALRACGAEAVLGGRSAGQHWRYTDGPPFPITVTTSTGAGRERKRITLSRAVLHPSETARAGPLRVTSPARTLIDLHVPLGPRRRRELIEHAQDIRRDKARDRELIGARWIPARFTYEDVAFEPGSVVAELRKIATVGSPMRPEPHTSRGV